MRHVPPPPQDAVLCAAALSRERCGGGRLSERKPAPVAAVASTLPWNLRRIEGSDTASVRLAAARLVVPEGVVIGGAAAAWIHGAVVGIEPWPIEVTGDYGERFKGPPGIRRRYAKLEEGDVVTIDGQLVLAPLRTAFDLSRFYDVVRGTAAVDAMLNSGLVVADDFVAYVDCRPGWTGVPRSREICGLMDGGAESVQETRLRLTFVWGGLPRPETQVVVLDHFGHVVARLDVGYRERRVGGEYDGAQHFETEAAVTRDLSRHNDLLDYGWTAFRFCKRDFRTPLVMVRRMASALGMEPNPTRSFALLSCL